MAKLTSTYRAAVEWIAECCTGGVGNDAVGLAAELFGVAEERVASDVQRQRAAIVERERTEACS
jgi:hypothetical protein